MIEKAIQLKYHPKAWKRAWEILLKKGRKQDFDLVRAYQVISLLNYMIKVLEKIIREQLLKFCKAYSKLYPRQISVEKKRSAIDPMTLLIYIVQESWLQNKLARALFINVKRAFDHILRS